MKALLKRKLLVAAVAAALLGGGAVAVAATRSSSSSGREAYLADVARRLGVSPSALKSAMQAAGIDKIEAAVADGRLTQAQASALEQRVREGHGPLSGKLLHPGAHGGPLAAAARYLGLTPLALRAQRAAGKSLAAIAAATPGKTAQGLAAAVTSAEKARLAAAVSSGHITSHQAERRLHALSPRVQTLLGRTAPSGPGALRHGG
jgi:hypothetical protein